MRLKHRHYFEPLDTKRVYANLQVREGGPCPRLKLGEGHSKDHSN